MVGGKRRGRVIQQIWVIQQNDSLKQLAKHHEKRPQFCSFLLQTNLTEGGEEAGGETEGKQSRKQKQARRKQEQEQKRRRQRRAGRPNAH